jgi:hypothetical protein
MIIKIKKKYEKQGDMNFQKVHNALIIESKNTEMLELSVEKIQKTSFKNDE